MEKFANYNSTDFLNEDTFIAWIMKSDKSAIDFWEHYIKENPSKKEEIDEALEIFSHFRFIHEELTLDEIFTIWNNVRHNPAKKRTGIFSILKYAAIFILIFFTGVLSYYFYNRSNPSEFSIAQNSPVNVEEAQIVLADGKAIPLEQKDSEIKYDTSGKKVIVNQDTITQESTPQKPNLNRVIIPYGKSSLITLSDGTKVWLNAGSQLMYPSLFSLKKREVLLVGEAFFEVTENKEQPFVVRTELADVEVLGTSFDVSAYADDKIFETVLVKGSVSVGIKKEGLLAGKEHVVLLPNQRIAFNKEENISKVSEVNISSYTSWKERMFQFEKEDLNRILKRLERYYNKRIQLKDPLLGGYKISGKLDLKSSLSEVLDVIQMTVPIDWGKQKNGDYFIVKSN